MAIKSLQATVDRWKASTALGAQAYLDGVAQTDVDVVGRAIAALPQAAAAYQQAISSGRTARRLAAVGTQGWKQAVAAKGGANWTNGVNNGAQKFASRMGSVLQFEAGLQQQIQSMPSGGGAAADARMLAWKHGMEQAKANGTFD
jgi:hypothetical protein